jgi:alpha-tubulin N-acetyltransferase 1
LYGFAVIHADNLLRLSQPNRNSLEAVVDEMGNRSAKAQGLGSVITTVRRMMHTDQRLYVMRSDKAVMGILKVGRKKLFIRDNTSGKMHELEPLCVLDFYVHETIQRGGVGKQLFEFMLAQERTQVSTHQLPHHAYA